MIQNVLTYKYFTHAASIRSRTKMKNGVETGKNIFLLKYAGKVSSAS